MTRSGRGMFGAVVACMVLLGLVGIGLAGAVRREGVVRTEMCMQIVGLREANRAMWTWLVQQFPEDDIASATQLQLDVLMPPFECIDAVPTPTLENR